MDVLILGATARAAAASALRAGLNPAALDLFADRDLRSICSASAIPFSGFPHAFLEPAAEFPPGPWIYTGSLENHPEFVDRLAEVRPLWGNSGAPLRACRDPAQVASVLRNAGFPCPAVSRSTDGLPRDGRWLVKPLASAGGSDIRVLDDATEPPQAPFYCQARIAGLDLSAIFVGDGDRARLLGITRQFIGRAGAPFAYAGTLAPWPLAPSEEERIRRLGDVLAASFGLKGLFGVDLILSRGIPWPVEINPRYTAAVEILELAFGRSLLAEHARVFAALGNRPPETHPTPARRFVGKRVVFALRPCVFPETVERTPQAVGGFAIPRLADIPEPGTQFDTGDPVVTVFASGSTHEACQIRLERRKVRWEKRLADE